MALFPIAAGCGGGFDGGGDEGEADAGPDAATDGGGDAGDGDAAAWVGLGWAIRLGGAEDDEALAVAANEGGAYVTGGFRGAVDVGGDPHESAGDEDAFVLALDPSGEPRWAKSYGGAGPDLGRTMALDDEGRVYVAGTFSDELNVGGEILPSAGGSDIFVAAFSERGGNRWSRRFGGEDAEEPSGIAADGAASLYLTGRHEGGAVNFGGGGRGAAEGGEGDVFVTSLDGGSLHRWSDAFGTHGVDGGRALSVDDVGNAYLVGGCEDGIDLGGGAIEGESFVASFTPNGAVRNLLAVSQHRWSLGLVGVRATAIAADGDGNSFVTGAFRGSAEIAGHALESAGEEDGFLASFDSHGLPRWSIRFGGPGIDAGTAVAVDSSGRVYLAGTFEGTADLAGEHLASVGDGDFLVASFTSRGARRWTRRFGDGEDGTGETPHAIAVDDAGRVTLVGSFSGTVDLGGGALESAGGTDVFVLQLVQ